MSRQNISQKYSKKGIDYYLAITLGLRVGVAPCRDNLRCARSSRIYMPNPNFLAIIVSEISSYCFRNCRVHPTDRTERLVCVETDGLGDLIVNPYRQTDDMARSTRLVILVKNSAFIRTDRQKDIARSTRLVMLIKNILTRLVILIKNIYTNGQTDGHG